MQEYKICKNTGFLLVTVQTYQPNRNKRVTWLSSRYQLSKGNSKFSKYWVFHSKYLVF